MSTARSRPRFVLIRRAGAVSSLLTVLAVSSCDSDPGGSPSVTPPTGGSAGESSSLPGGSGGAPAPAGGSASAGQSSGGTASGGRETSLGGDSGGEGGLGGFGGELAAGTCAHESRATPYAEGMRVASPSGLVVTLLRSDPEPSVATHTWHITIDYQGTALPGARLLVTPFMPDHGHGSTATPQVTDEGAGAYTVTRVKFTMPGFWRTTVRVTMPTWTDSVALPLCIEA